MATKRSYTRAKWGVYTGSTFCSFPYIILSTTRYTHGMGCSAFYRVFFFRDGTTLPGFLFWITTWDRGLGGRRGCGLPLTNGLDAWDRDHHTTTTIITTTSTIIIWAEILFFLSFEIPSFSLLRFFSLRGGLVGWASFATCVICTYHLPSSTTTMAGRPAQGPHSGLPPGLDP
ncbi:hypothetical protein BC567DRAFT_36528 [Phyllosticta citribraziliensis]